MKNANIYEEIGKTLAPVEIEDQSQLESLGITWKNVISYTVGRRVVRIWPCPAPEEVCREMLLSLREEYGKEDREDRCMIHGAYGMLRVCPEKYSCDSCPFSAAERVPRVVSLDAMQEEGLEPAATQDKPEVSARARMVMEAIRKLPEVNRRVMELHIAGYTDREIGEKLGLSRKAVSNRRDRVTAALRDQFC